MLTWKRWSIVPACCDLRLSRCYFCQSQEDVLCWEGKAKGRGKDRHLFLFERLLIGTKTKETRNDEFTYCFKFSCKVRTTLQFIYLCFAKLGLFSVCRLQNQWVDVLITRKCSKRRVLCIDALREGGTWLGDGRRSAARFSESFLLLITKPCLHTHFHDILWSKTTFKENQPKMARKLTNNVNVWFRAIHHRVPIRTLIED